MARGRPATPPGSSGDINTKQLDNGKWEADTRLRLHNGKTKRIRRRGKTKTAATLALKQQCTRELGATDTATLTTNSPLSHLLEEWITTKTDIRDQSTERYRAAINKHINPAIGGLRLNEITPAYLDHYLRGYTPDLGNTIYTVLKGAFKMATRYNLTPTNPILSVDRPRKEKKKPKTLTPEQIEEFREQIRQSGDTFLMDIVDFCLSTGLRAGELLALRFDDIDMTTSPPVMHVNATMAQSKQNGNHRQPRGKTDKSNRYIALNTTARAIIERRHKNHGEHINIVFPSIRGTYMNPSTLSGRIRRARGKTFTWVTIHTFRKTLATITTDNFGADKAAELLGHSNSKVTQEYYHRRGIAGSESGPIIDQLLRDGGT